MLDLLIAVCTYIIIDEIRNQGMMNQLEEDSEKEEF